MCFEAAFCYGLKMETPEDGIKAKVKKKKNLNTKVSAYETVANLSRKHWQQWIELQDALQWELRFSLVPLLLKPV